MGKAPSGTIAFLFTDLEGSTRLWDEHRTTMERAVEDHDRILRAAIERERGYVFSTQGDAFAAAFDSVPAAARCAMAIQRSLEEHDWPTPTPLRARIGLHVGEAQERDGDYFGPTLNRAARIMSAAHGGQTVASAAFAALADGAIGGPIDSAIDGADDDQHPFALIDLGEHRLKDLAAPERIFQIGHGVHPNLRTLDVSHHNLPVERTALYGRTTEIAAIADALGEHRLVSILGMGGTGKTRVAIASAAELVDRFPDGVWFVDLVPVGGATDIAQAIAAAAGYRIGGADLLASLVEVARERSALFVLDNCEHISDAVADVLDELLTRTTNPRFIATSREPLELPDEFQLPLLPLAVAADERSPAVELFVNAAALVGARIDVENDTDALTAVAAICEHLDGHPLSIELAAAQLRQLTVEQLASRLEHRFELLTRGRSTNRQASLLAVLDDTWEMLDADGRALLVQLGAFPGAFGLEEIEEVVAGPRAGGVAHDFGGLVDRSLVVADGSGRHRLLETVKLFAQRQPGASDATERHTGWLLERLRAEPPDARYTSFVLRDWIVRHLDDWTAVEHRLAAEERWTELGELVLHSIILYFGAPGPRAVAMIHRVERHLESESAMPDSTVAALNLAAANAGLPARRPDWIERGSGRSSELLAGGDPIDLAAAMILRSWIPALTDPDRAIEMLREAFDLAESADASALANVARAYEAVHVALDGRLAESRRILDALQPRLPRHLDNASNVSLLLRMAIDAIDAPASATAAVRRWDADYVDLPVRNPLLTAMVMGAVGDTAETVRRLDQAVDEFRRFSNDSGLPDLLIPPAAIAFSRGDTERCRRLITAVRRSPVPTQNFMHTVIYRQLRDRVGLAEDDPLDHQPIEQIFQDARAWMNTLDPVA